MISAKAETHPTLFQIGDQVDRYRIQEILAVGGMSTIFRAYDLIHRKDVALKVPDTGLIGDPALYERFQREIDITRDLNHPAVLKGLFTGYYNRIPYLVTELVEGRNLRSILDLSAPCDPAWCVDVMYRVADGLAYCHAHGVIHRDLKPENIIVKTDGQPVIMDFGLSLTSSSHRVTYSNLSVSMGTPDYMAPEQVEGHRGDARTDIYALGIILFEMLTGQTPFSGENPLSVMAMRVTSEALAVGSLRNGLDPHLAALVMWCLKKNPDERCPNVTVLMHALKEPNSVNLAVVLDQNPPSFLRKITSSPGFRMGLIAVGVTAFLLMISVVLQALKP